MRTHRLAVVDIARALVPCRIIAFQQAVLIARLFTDLFVQLPQVIGINAEMLAQYRMGPVQGQ